MTNYLVPVVQYYPGYSQVQVHQNLLYKTIASITNSNPMVVTTSFNHHYVAGMDVRFLIPQIFGMQQLNKRMGQVTQLTANTLTINIDSTSFTPFAYPSPFPQAYTPPSIIPNSSGPYLNPPPPLPYGNQDSFEGVIFNNGTFGNPIDGGNPP
jgi:hypothetical protein